MNILSKIGVLVVLVCVFIAMVSECSHKPEVNERKEIEQQANVILREKAKGLDLAAVTGLVRRAANAEEFERLLNSSSEAVSNLDLNDDGKVDYIKVSEYGSGARRGFSLTTELNNGEEQEIATIDFAKDSSGSSLQTTGNPALYGNQHYHHANFDLGDLLLVNWLFSNRPAWSSPYGGGYYPSDYDGGWQKRSQASYDTVVGKHNPGSLVSSSSSRKINDTAVSPNAGKMAAKAKALTSATQSQRAFGSRSSSSSRSSSRAFGRSSSSFSRSGGSFGGGK